MDSGEVLRIIRVSGWYQQKTVPSNERLDTIEVVVHI